MIVSVRDQLRFWMLPLRSQFNLDFGPSVSARNGAKRPHHPNPDRVLPFHQTGRKRRDFGSACIFGWVPVVFCQKHTAGSRDFVGQFGVAAKPLALFEQIAVARAEWDVVYPRFEAEASTSSSHSPSQDSWDGGSINGTLSVHSALFKCVALSWPCTKMMYLYRDNSSKKSLVSTKVCVVVRAQRMGLNLRGRPSTPSTNVTRHSVCDVNDLQSIHQGNTNRDVLIDGPWYRLSSHDWTQISQTTCLHTNMRLHNYMAVANLGRSTRDYSPNK